MLNLSIFALVSATVHLTVGSFFSPFTNTNSSAIVWCDRITSDRLSQTIARSKKWKINIYKVQSVRWMPNVDPTSDQFTKSLGNMCVLLALLSSLCSFIRCGSHPFEWTEHIFWEYGDIFFEIIMAAWPIMTIIHPSTFITY